MFTLPKMLRFKKVGDVKKATGEIESRGYKPALLWCKKER